MPLASIDDVNIYYEIEGEGFPVVLAHGYCTTIALWKHLIPPLSRRYQVIAYDARGHGFSTAPSGAEHYTQKRLADDLKGLLDHLGVDRAIIAGHSMGGATAIAFAHAHPQMSRAVLICNIDGGHQPYDRGVGSETDELRKRGRRIVEKRGLVDYARRIIERKMAPRFVMESEAQQADFIERYARQPQNGFFGAGDARPWTEPWLKEAAANLSMPVAILAAQEDELHQGAELLHAALPDSHFVSIADAPHDAMNARPAAFNSAFLDYLDSLETQKPLSGRRTM